jgi:hypothetical protein
VALGLGTTGFPIWRRLPRGELFLPEGVSISRRIPTVSHCDSPEFSIFAGASCPPIDFRPAAFLFLHAGSWWNGLPANRSLPSQAVTAVGRNGTATPVIWLGWMLPDLQTSVQCGLQIWQKHNGVVPGGGFLLGREVLPTRSSGSCDVLTVVVRNCVPSAFCEYYGILRTKLLKCAKSQRWIAQSHDADRRPCSSCFWRALTGRQDRQPKRYYRNG